MTTVYILVGVPGSGKTWTAQQLQNKFVCLPHDDFKNTDLYLSTILGLSKTSTRPILVETPFSVSQFTEFLTDKDVKHECIFIIDSPETIAQQYFKREGKVWPKGNATRLNTYRQRATQMQAFQGTSEQCLKYLLTKV